MRTIWMPISYFFGHVTRLPPCCVILHDSKCQSHHETTQRKSLFKCGNTRGLSLKKYSTRCESIIGLDQNRAEELRGVFPVDLRTQTQFIRMPAISTLKVCYTTTSLLYSTDLLTLGNDDDVPFTADLLIIANMHISLSVIVDPIYRANLYLFAPSKFGVCQAHMSSFI